LILADVFLLFIDLSALIFGTLSLGLSLLALFIFYSVVGAFAFVLFALVEFLSGRGILESVLNGVLASVLLVIPFPVASLVAFIFSSEAGYGRMYRSYGSYAYLAVFLAVLVLSSLSFLSVSAQVPVVSASRLSSWGFFCESVSYKVYEVAVSFTGDSLKSDVLDFCALRLASRSNEFSTIRMLIAQGSGVDLGDVRRSSSALARDLRVAEAVAPSVASSVEGRSKVVYVAGLSSSVVNSAQVVASLTGVSSAGSDVESARRSSLALAVIGSGGGLQ